MKLCINTLGSWLSSLSILPLIIGLCSCSQKEDQKTNSEPLKLKVVRFANLPYADHCYNVIGLSNGWFREAGIDLKITTAKVEEVVPGLDNGTFDAISVPPGMLFSAYDSSTNLCSFVFSDLFQGFALMAQSNQGLKGYSEFIKDGMNPTDAIAATARQLKGRTFAYPTETAVKPFIDRLLSIGGIARDDFKSLVLDDPLTVNAMRNKQADFQVGGVPSRITLQKEGFIPLISSIDLAKGAAASADSQELASILQNGWAVTKDYYLKEHATVLRLASVNYRIMSYMQSNRLDAIRIHMAYLSQITGQQFDAADGEVIYGSLDPFWTFDEQKEWFHNSGSPLYYAYINGAILKSFISDKVFKHAPPTVDDVIFADDTYRELEGLKTKTDEYFAKAGHMNLTPGAKEKLSVARQFYAGFNFYDAERLAKDALSEGVAK